MFKCTISVTVVNFKLTTSSLAW